MTNQQAPSATEDESSLCNTCVFTSSHCGIFNKNASITIHSCSEYKLLTTQQATVDENEASLDTIADFLQRNPNITLGGAIQRIVDLEALHSQQEEKYTGERAYTIDEIKKALGDNSGFIEKQFDQFDKEGK